MDDLVAPAQRYIAGRRPRTERPDGSLRSPSSDRARTSDLCRWGRIFAMALGRDHLPWRESGDLTVDLAGLRAEDLTTDVCTRALSIAEGHYAAASLRRMVSTLRGFLRYLVRTGALTADPLDVEVFTLPSPATPRPRAVSDTDLDAMRAAAALPVPSGSRGMLWPTRDVAVVDLLAGCGLRVSEASRARWGWIDERAERPVLRVDGKGGRRRDVPIPRRVDASLRAWRAELVAEEFPVTPVTPVLVHPDGSPVSTSSLDRVIRAIARRSGTALPAGAAAHALRHHYGTTLALRGVPLTFISQLLGHADPRTTEIYTRVAAIQLFDVLDDAGLL